MNTKDSEFVSKLEEYLCECTDYSDNLVSAAKFGTFEKRLFNFLSKYKEDADLVEGYGSDYDLAELVVRYCVISGDSTKIEPLIADKPYQIYYHCYHTKGGCNGSAQARWLEAEPVVLSNINIAISYAESVIGDRWPELDTIIANHKSEDADKHRGSILRYIGTWENKQRWLEVEPIIFKCVKTTKNYVKLFDRRTPEAEPTLLKQIDAAAEYVEQFKFRWPEYEKKIIKKPNRIFHYARRAIGGKLPDDLHNRMLMNRMTNDCQFAESYFDYLSSLEEKTLNFLRSLDDEQRAEFLRKLDNL